MAMSPLLLNDNVTLTAQNDNVTLTAQNDNVTLTAQWQCHPHSLSIKCVAFESIKQLLLTYMNLSTSALYAQWL